MTEVETLRAELIETKAELLVARRDLAAKDAELKSQRESMYQMLNDPDNHVRVFGEKLGDVKQIAETLAEWHKIGGRPEWLEQVRTQQELRARIAELEAAT